MKTSNILIPTLLAGSLVACSDSPNEIRQLQCHDPIMILPVELIELEKATKSKVVCIFGGRHLVDGTHPISWTIEVKTVTILSEDGKAYSMTRDIETFLIPKPKNTPKSAAIEKSQESKYNLK